MWEREKEREDLELKWKKKRKDHKFIQSRFFKMVERGLKGIDALF